MVTYFLVSPLFPSAGAWCCLPHAPLLRGPRQVPAVKMQRAMRTLQTMLLRCSVPSWMRPEKSFLGLTKCFGGTGSSSSDLVGYGRSGDARRDESRQLRCLAAQGEVEVARRVSCVPCGARRTSAPSQLPEPEARLRRRQTPPTWPSSEDRATPWPSLSRRTGPRSPGPERPLLDSGR